MKKKLAVPVNEVVELYQTQIRIGQLQPGQLFPSRKVITENLKIGHSAAFQVVQHLKTEGLIEKSIIDPRFYVVCKKGEAG